MRTWRVETCGILESDDGEVSERGYDPGQGEGRGVGPGGEERGARKAHEARDAHEVVRMLSCAVQSEVGANSEI